MACITCVRKFITKECNVVGTDACETCKYNECTNCTQYGNLDCDGDVIVTIEDIKKKEEHTNGNS